MSAIEFTEEDLEARMLRPTAPSRLAETFHQVAGRVAKAHGLTTMKMLGVGRFKHLAEARRELYRELRVLGWSYPEIGRACMGRDHTTIMYALSAKRRKHRHGDVTHIQGDHHG